MFSVGTIVGSLLIVFLINYCEDKSVCCIMCILVSLLMLWDKEN
jgi:hypothetical protein